MKTPSAPRLLVVSAGREPDDGVAEWFPHREAERLWPGVEVRLVGLGLSPAALRLLGALTNADGTASAGGAGDAVGAVARAVAGRLLAPVVDRERADLILSADRITTVGVEWLRRERGLGVPTRPLAAKGRPAGAERDEGAATAALRELVRAAPAPGPRRLGAPDALFVHVDSPSAPQHVGAVLVFDPGPPLRAQHAADMLGRVPGVLGRIRPATALVPALWTPVDRTALSLVDTVSAADHGAAPAAAVADEVPEALTAAVDRFFSEPSDPAVDLGRARLVTDLPDGRSALLVKLHHALGDGLTVLQALLSDTEGGGALSWAARPVGPVRGSGWAVLRVGPRRLARGLRMLATAGRAPRTPVDTEPLTPNRRHVLVRLPGRTVRAHARAAGVTPAEWLTSAFAHAVSEVAASGTGEAGDPPRFRLMVPWSVRGTDSMRLAGNHTGAVSVDLPVGGERDERGERAERADRARTVAAALRERIEAGVPEAANLMVHLLSVLPPRVHGAAARAVYRRDWFNAIGTVLPGPRRTVRWHGRVMTEAYPVLALAPGTGLAWGALTWGEAITVCVTAPAPAPAHLSALAAAFHRAATTASP